ncbi:YveK family protein [Sporosalibacterium faouarense]|uniref:YveK family protein n=1 Tax=Sporosalibacterium faouarense TaxID=516123 RepID=UPI00192BF82A|nr:Wzz/FepE/Etk N-terminal domain-containing protein [Sporosalibacterium faouarense]
MEEIELRELMQIIWRKAWLIILITVITVAASGVVSFFVLESQYETYTTLMIGQPNGSEYKLDINEVRLNQSLVSTYGEITKSRIVTNEVINNMGLNMTHKDLINMISVSSVKDTEIIKISVNGREPELISKIADEIAVVLKKHIANIMHIENIQVIDKAEVPTAPVKPNPILNMAIAGVLGGMISIFLVFLMEYMDNTVKSSNDIEKYLELPVIGMIPETNG